MNKKVKNQVMSTILNGRNLESLAVGEKYGVSDNWERTEGLLFKSICTYEKYKTIVEIGSQFGETTFYLAQAAEVNEGKVFSYDFYDEIGIYKAGGHGNIEIIKKRLEKYLNRVKLTKIDSQSPEFKNVLEKDTGGKIDFVFIDGDHSYEGVKNDFLNVYPLMSENGTIVFHDTGNHIGVRKFIIELYTELNDGTFSLINMPYGGPGENGIAILRKNCWAKQNKGVTFDFLKSQGVINYHGNDKEINVEEVYEKEKEWYYSSLRNIDNENKIKIFFDGTEIKENAKNEVIVGFTTNISFMKQAGISDYDSFIKESLKHSKGRPISFQLYDEEDEEIIKTARKICSYDNSIYVKIPVMKSNGEYNSKVIKQLHEEGLKINVTAIFYKEQIESLIECFTKDTPAIISIFAGRINDCGNNSSGIVNYAKEKFSHLKEVEILWAACRTVYNIIEAEQQGADIVTIPESVVKRINRLNDNIEDAGLKAVQQFRNDGIEGNIKF